MYVDCGVTLWKDGGIDIAPEYLDANVVPAYNMSGFPLDLEHI